MHHRLAVYGTLAPGRENHWMLAPLAGRWLTGFVRGRRVEAGWGNDFGFPGLQLDPHGEPVAVDVLESDQLATHWDELDLKAPNTNVFSPKSSATARR
jgi:gamma-glutamylcyclotransferase (GGCT)/AIG2-like uncharacterized protein YtfP